MVPTPPPHLLIFSTSKYQARNEYMVVAALAGLYRRGFNNIHEGGASLKLLKL